jgi:antibiotic biosynthesis monooxygenase (ABM) superfamily enzyme
MSDDEPRRAGPPRRHKQAVIVWLGAYPVITIILATLGPAMRSWPLPLQTFVVSILMVLVLTWLVLPLLTRIFGSWMGR